MITPENPVTAAGGPTGSSALELENRALIERSHSNVAVSFYKF